MEIDQANLDEAKPEIEQQAPERSMAEVAAEKLAEIRARNVEPENGESGEKSSRVRAADGKFAKADGEAKPEPNAAPAPEAAQAAQKQDVQPEAATEPQTQQAASAQPPSSFTAEGKAEFAKASPALQKEILKREADFHKGIEPYKQAANYAQTMHKAIQPYENTIKQWGVTPDVAIRALFEADRKLTTGTPQEKLAAFANLARGYGIDLSQGLPEQAPVDQNFQYMQTQQQQLQQRLQQIEERNQQLAAQVAQREQSELNSLIEQAKQGKPHFDELRHDIGVLLQAAVDKGQPITLDQAYEAALWQSPTHRQELLAKQRAELEAEVAKKRAEEAEKAKAARQASSTNVQKRGTLQAHKPVGDVKDFMREKLAEIRSR